MDSILVSQQWWKQRLLDGPWPAFERDVARLLGHNGFQDVRLVGGCGDQGADIIAVNSLGLWILQCKHTTTSAPSIQALDEVVNACEFYKPDNLCVVVSRPPNETFFRKRDEYSRGGTRIRIWGPTELLKMVDQASQFHIGRIIPYPYQETAIEAILSGIRETKRSQVIMATGLGKTVVMAEVVARLYAEQLLPNARVLVLAHTKPLVNQLHSSFWRQLPLNIPTHQMAEGERPAFWEGVTFATVQSINSSINHIPSPDLCIIDEAHHLGADTFQSVIKKIEPLMILGATATPWRGDGFAIDSILGPPCVKMSVSDGLAKGYLSEVDYRLLADNIDWNLVQELSKNKYSVMQLNRRLIIPTRDDKAAQIIADIFNRENRYSGIVFSPSVAHAREFTGFLRGHGLSCELITANLGAREVDLKLARFRHGEFNIAVTVDLFNEGIDVPDVDLVVFMRATHSRRIFVQQLGRGLRVSPRKKYVVVLDFVSDLKRMAQVLDLDQSVRSLEVEKVGLGRSLVAFSDESAGTFLKEWMLDQTDLSDKRLSAHELSSMDFPEDSTKGVDPNEP